MRIENSFIPVEGVGETTERRIWREGVTTWESFDPAVDVAGVGSTTADRIESFIAEALTHLDDGDSAYFDRTFPSGERWRLYENFREETCFFDIETTGLDEHRDRVTTVSFHRDGETTTLVAGEDLTAERLREQFADASLLATFNGARFDVPFLETAFDIEIDTPHLDLMYPLQADRTLWRAEADREGNRDRARPPGPLGPGRRPALAREYERGDDDALDTLVSYNREDTKNLRTLADTVTETLHEDVFVGETVER